MYVIKIANNARVASCVIFGIMWTADYSHKGPVMQKAFQAMTSILYK